MTQKTPKPARKAPEDPLSIVLSSVAHPIQDFLNTGLYRGGHSILDEERHNFPELKVSGSAVRNVAMSVAQLAKRPFIEIAKAHRYSQYRTVIDEHGKRTTKLETLDPPLFLFVELTVPKRKYLTPLVNPLFLTAVEARSPLAQKGGHPVTSQHTTKNWVFCISDQKIWDDYEVFLDTPEARKTRRAPLE